jgi:hypothetical protein
VAKLGRLIQGQDVTFDTHQAGDGQEINWRSLHLEKRLHRGGKIRFHLFGDAEPTYSDRVSEKDFFRVVREVRDTLHKNEKLATQLAETIVVQVQRFRGGAVTTETALEAARNIARAFDLGEPFVGLAEVAANARIARFSTIHPGKRPGTVVEIVQDARQVSVQRPTGSWGRWRRDVG